jgi:hypothetical protein
MSIENGIQKPRGCPREIALEKVSETAETNITTDVNYPEQPGKSSTYLPIISPTPYQS